MTTAPPMVPAEFKNRSHQSSIYPSSSRCRWRLGKSRVSYSSFILLTNLITCNPLKAFMLIPIQFHSLEPYIEGSEHGFVAVCSYWYSGYTKPLPACNGFLPLCSDEWRLIAYHCVRGLDKREEKGLRATIRVSWT
ncbi:unnamed protein product [Periconia digitata]|uniref:Uncharacterized protein n=1 Tax=Periconia digitata TaxID=1303443 RepID=A0A9W4U9F8_9PLEO|nr:unnamed protein product [Periconia digitata]